MEHLKPRTRSRIDFQLPPPPLPSLPTLTQTHARTHLLRASSAGNGPILGLAPAPECMFLVYVSPVGAYFKGGQLTPIDLVVSDTFHRAAPGGAGGTKCVGNYAQVLVTQVRM